MGIQRARAMSSTIITLLECIFAYVFPPVGVFCKFGCGTEVIICTILTCCAYVPGLIYALVMIGCKHPKQGDDEAAGELVTQNVHAKAKLHGIALSRLFWFK